MPKREDLERAQRDAQEAAAQLAFAMVNYPQHLHVASFDEMQPRVIPAVPAKPARGGRKRPVPGKPAELRMYVPPAVAAAIEDPEAVGYRTYMVMIRTEALERKESRVILPGERGVT